MSRLSLSLFQSHFKKVLFLWLFIDTHLLNNRFTAYPLFHIQFLPLHGRSSLPSFLFQFVFKRTDSQRNCHLHVFCQSWFVRFLGSISSIVSHLHLQVYSMPLIIFRINLIPSFYHSNHLLFSEWRENHPSPSLFHKVLTLSESGVQPKYVQMSL